MANFMRYRPVLSGWVGGPGVNTWNAEPDVLPFPDGAGAQGWADAVRAAYDAMKFALVESVIVTFPAEVTVHDEATGDLVGAVGITAPAVVTSTGTSGSRQVGRDTQLVVALSTDTIRDARRLQGRHFIGPINSNSLDGNGQIVGSTRTAIESAYGGVLDAPGGNLVVYGPPKLDDEGNVTSPGRKGRVTGVTVRTVPGTLRSRKT